MKITASIALFLGQINGADPPANGNFFYIDFPDLIDSDHTHGQHEVRMMTQSKSDPDKYETYPLFLTTQESTIGLFSSDCSDCKSKKKFVATDAVGYKAGSTEGSTEWVSVFDKKDEELRAFNFMGSFASTPFKLGLDLFKRETSLT